ncbi:hypothetical protein NECAME_06814 [Necator americanus]|uniref:Uncharacterized protein n=1 Tax=Necator americanus TaxID=51031 RepID=W2TRX3_NECAM|nr:hypothetical protein NECAME_06814 [Necator americanus]ETN84578.1 hypothetical protein NECAME_06814 [Necator americanus]
MSFQHSSVDSKVRTPSHCAPPKWTSPNTLKHYFLLHDVTGDDEDRSKEVFNEMCSTYGVDACQILRIGEGRDPDELPDVWSDAEEDEIILSLGLRRAVQHATASAMAQQTIERKPAATSTVSTISPSYAMVQSSNLSSTEINGFPGGAQLPSRGGRNISSIDRENLRNITQKFLKDCLVSCFSSSCRKVDAYSL